MSRLTFITALICVWSNYASADPVEILLDHYRNQCLSILEDERDINADLDQIISDPLHVSDDSIYEISLSTSGITAIVVYVDFECQGIGSGWCGSSGCASYIIVEEQIFGPLNGGRPFTTSFVTPYGNERTLLLVGVSGLACSDGYGERGINADLCYMSAVWDDHNRTFRANGDLVVLRGKLDE